MLTPLELTVKLSPLSRLLDAKTQLASTLTHSHENPLRFGVMTAMVWADSSTTPSIGS